MGVGAVAAFALLLQLWILIANHVSRGESAWAALWLFAGYFTIWTNTVVAIVALGTAFGQRTLSGHCVHSATAVYIFVVMLIYELLLRQLWAPAGAQWWADFLLHNAVPVLWISWWLAFSRKGGLAYAAALRWLAYPLIYLAYALIRGALTGFYAYPFLDVSQHGYGKVAMSAAAISLLFVVIALALIAIDRRLARVN